MEGRTAVSYLNQRNPDGAYKCYKQGYSVRSESGGRFMDLGRVGTRELALLPKASGDFPKEAGLFRIVAVVVICGQFSQNSCCAFSLFS